ncbi:MAG: class I SAM-dependent methyltransferase [Anaerolineae bacterium]
MPAAALSSPFRAAARPCSRAPHKPMTPGPDFDVIAHYYDLLYAERDDDLPMWLHLTEAAGGDILEIGCGTGRVMLPLLQQGRRVTGVDLSAAALDIARAKINGAGFARRATLYQADMRALNLPQHDFAFAFIPINTFMHCLTLPEQQSTLAGIRNHLKPGGALVVDLYHPQPQALFEADGRMVMANQLLDDRTGHTVQWFVVRHLQPEQQIQDVTFILDDIDPAGAVHRRTVSFPMRYLHRFEMELLLQSARFQLQTIWGDYDQSAFDAGSPRMIFMARKV